MHISLINDGDENSLGRQAARVASLFNSNVTTIKVEKFSEIQVAGNLIDQLDAVEDRDGVVLVNAAPRHGRGKHWQNGTPFGYFKYKNILVVSTVDGYSLSLVKKLKLVDKFYLLDIPSVTRYAVEKELISSSLREHIINTQYRSFDFEPRVAKWLADGYDLPVKEYSFDVDFVSDIQDRIWWIDNYGNTKTSILESELAVKDGYVQTNFGGLKFFPRLKDVPNNEVAIIVGSSGLPGKRFIEIVVQGGSAAEKLGLEIGLRVLKK